MMSKKLNVKKTTKKEVQEKWNMQLPKQWADNLYIRCNAKGVVNWKVAPIYELNELEQRGNYNVHG